MPTEAEYTELPVRITRDGIYFGDEKVPGCIEANSVTLIPGMTDGMNRLTVTFLVGPVEAVDPMTEKTTVDWPAQEITRYREGEHTTDCAWSLADCDYKQTHHYCPHPEHACTCKSS